MLGLNKVAKAIFGLPWFSVGHKLLRFVAVRI